VKRLLLAVAVISSLVSAVTAQEPIPPGRMARQATPESTPAQPPRHYQRFKYSSYGVWVRTNAPGYPAYRYTYSGQKDGFPMPAIFQSGMEHSNWTYGPGF
jgi:hypothetical protein